MIDPYNCILDESGSTLPRHVQNRSFIEKSVTIRSYLFAGLLKGIPRQRKKIVTRKNNNNKQKGHSPLIGFDQILSK